MTFWFVLKISII